MSKKKKKKKTYVLTWEEIKKYEKRGHDKAMEKAFVYASLVPMFVLRDKYGFGEKRLGEFFDELNILTNDINDGYLSLKDIADTITKETGLEIVLDKDLW